MRLRVLIGSPLATGLIACLIGILTAQGTMQGFVLCWGADEHFAVEVSIGSEGTCNIPSASLTRPTASLELLANDSALSSHCGPCRDFALTHTDSFYVRPGSVRSQRDWTNFAGLVVLVLPSKSGIQPVGGYGSHKQSAVLSTPLHLRSTLLLI